MRAFILAAVLLMLGVSPLIAQRGPEARMWKKMNLTEDQIKALKDVRADTQKKMVDLRAALNKKRIDMRSLMESEAPDRTAFEALSRDIADLQVKQKLLLFDADREVIKHLDAEQQKQWKTIKHGRMQRMERGMREFGEQLHGKRPPRDDDDQDED